MKPSPRSVLLALSAIFAIAYGAFGSHLADGAPPHILAAVVKAFSIVLLGLVAYFYMNDRPSDASWLTPRQKVSIAEHQSAAAAGARRHASLRNAFRDPTTYVLAVAYVAVISGTSTIALWAPTLLREFGLHPSINGLLLSVPFTVAVFVMFLLSRSSDRHLERRWHYALAMWWATARAAASPIPARAQ